VETHKTSAAEPVAVVAAMRNEGPYLVEWVAYHQIIGFDPIVICSNDCTDGSDELLDRLADAGEILHIANPLAPGQAPQDGAMRRCFAALRDTAVEWLCHIDSDEFVAIELGDGTVADLMARCGQADVIGLCWRMFGDNGHDTRTLPILPNFTACARGPDPETTKFKSLFRFRKFGHANDHRPVDPLVDDISVVNAAGMRLRNNFRAGQKSGEKRAKYHPVARAIAPEAASINHYATRARDDFLMKNDRGDGQGSPGRKYHLGSPWHRLCNRNDAQNRRILRHWPAVAHNMTRLRALPGVAEAEARCLARDSARRAEILTPRNRQRWQMRAEPENMGQTPDKETLKEI
jgi:hypothetical protein